MQQDIPAFVEETWKKAVIATTEKRRERENSFWQSVPLFDHRNKISPISIDHFSATYCLQMRCDEESVNCK